MFTRLLFGTVKRREPFRFELQAAAYALDSTTIDRCLSLFPWATFRQHKAAIKLHTLLALQGNFPTVIIISTDSVHDINILDQMVWEDSAFYIIDRGYLDFARRCSRPVDKTNGLRFNQTVVLTGLDAQHDYPVVSPAVKALARVSRRIPGARKQGLDWAELGQTNFFEVSTKLPMALADRSNKARRPKNPACHPAVP